MSDGVKSASWRGESESEEKRLHKKMLHHNHMYTFRFVSHRVLSTTMRNMGDVISHFVIYIMLF